MKRFFDFAFALFLLIIFSPVILVLIFLVWKKLGKPIFFTQMRPGKNASLFKLYKFRTMRNPSSYGTQLLSDEARLTSFGKWLRATSLDELPQLFNVLKGDLSFVGPRPLLIEYLPLYNQEQKRRHEVKPGITGWAQINGRNAISWEEKFKFDVWYVDHHSFWLDLKIMGATFLKVFKREGVSADNHATMPFFTGNNTKKP
jgi:lipopolysaccharide/colanic/teichoic acid biosynthesis glycosyltransferase